MPARHRFIAAAWSDESGATSLEYALVGAAILFAMFAANTSFGDLIATLYRLWASAVVAAL